MKFTSQIKVADCTKEETEHIESLFFAEDKEIINGRASFKLFIEPSADNINDALFDLRFELFADDITALRAIFTLIIKVLHVFEKTKKLVVDDEQ